MTVFLVEMSFSPFAYSNIDLCVTILTEVIFLIVKPTLYLETSIKIPISLVPDRKTIKC